MPSKLVTLLLRPQHWTKALFLKHDLPFSRKKLPEIGKVIELLWPTSFCGTVTIVGTSSFLTPSDRPVPLYHEFVPLHSF